MVICWIAKGKVGHYLMITPLHLKTAFQRVTVRDGLFKAGGRQSDGISIGNNRLRARRIQVTTATATARCWCHN